MEQTEQTEQEKILALECKKHIKIYKLKQIGLSNKDIAEALKTNVGHVYNSLKDYDEHPEKKEAADKICNCGCDDCNEEEEKE